MVRPHCQLAKFCVVHVLSSGCRTFVHKTSKMLNVHRLLVVSAFVFALVLCCHAQKKSLNKYDLPARTSNQFAFRFHRLFASDGEKNEGNIVFSPVSLSMAVGMVYLGAQGNTSRQIEDTFKWNKTNGINIHAGFRYLRKRLTSAKSKNKANQISIANRIWAAENFNILPRLKNKTRQYYGAGIATSDFSQDPGRARRKINSWVNDRTEGKIKDLIPRGMLDALTKMVLVNAMYFKGTWKTKFSPGASKEWFDTSSESQNGSRVRVQMMAQRSLFNYFEDAKEKCQILELPYVGNESSMIVILPKKKAIHSLEENLTFGKLRRWIKYLSKKSVTVHLPKFQMSVNLETKSLLKRMGIVDLFTPGLADLSGITGGNRTGQLFVNDIVHEAFVEVNEQGTEAAAASGVVVTGRSFRPDQLVFRANHPFLFFIYHKETNTILFMGRVKRPTNNSAKSD